MQNWILVEFKNFPRLSVPISFFFLSKCLIDLKRNLLVIGTTGTETPFLSEGELPDCARLSGPRSEAESSSVAEMEDLELAKALNESASALPVDPNVIQSSDKFQEKQVQQIVSMGFQRQQVNVVPCVY